LKEKDMTKYQKVLLKLSGESLMGNGSYGISSEVLSHYSSDIASITEMGVQVAIVIGGGNIFRGISGTSRGFDRVKGDNMGMLATVINSIAIQSTLEASGIRAKVLTSIRMEPVGEYYSSAKAIEYMEAGYIVIVAGGTGNPFFTTDSAAALRGIELKADVLLKGTRVDGVYTADPEKYPNATKYNSLSFDEAYEKGLKIMDLTAFTLCRENALPILVFDMNTPGNLKKVVSGDNNTGTIIK
jgi:uridylate kinase